MLHGIDADGATLDGVTHGCRDIVDGERLHQAQDLDELAFAGLSHPRLEQAAQRGEFVWQLPIHQGGCLIERIDLALDQRQVMQQIEHEVLALIRPRVPGDDLGSARDYHLVHIAADEHLRVTVGGWYRVVVEPVAHQ
jgi:hypothetical protein